MFSIVSACKAWCSESLSIIWGGSLLWKNGAMCGSWLALIWTLWSAPLLGKHFMSVHSLFIFHAQFKMTGPWLLNARWYKEWWYFKSRQSTKQTSKIECTYFIQNWLSFLSYRFRNICLSIAYSWKLKNKKIKLTFLCQRTCCSMQDGTRSDGNSSHTNQVSKRVK